MQNGTRNGMMQGMGKFHGKAVLLMQPCFTSANTDVTKNGLIIYLKQCCSGLLKHYPYYTLRLKPACFVLITPCIG